MTTSTIVEVQAQHDQIRANLADIWARIQSLDNNLQVRRDLIALHTNIRYLWARMDNEMIECRKRSRATANYTEMAQELSTYLKLMEREVFWQKLH